MTDMSIGEESPPESAAGPLAGQLGTVSPAVIAALSAEQQAHLAGLIQRAVEHETAELLVDALSELDKVPSFLRRPLMKLLTK
ncbi:hypothetical protein [Nocardia sp. NPDC046763]|uniref:hypothetical protein n=1 Tax=Nocardia sp. NPDC046763 TaxID=3155256 RepID=UPI0033D39300